MNALDRPYFEIGTLSVPKLSQLGQHAPRHRYTERADAIELIREALLHDPSDIHINSGHPVLLEINGQLRRLTNQVLEWNEFENIARTLRDKEGATTMLSQGKDYDSSFTLTDSTNIRRRLRVNMTGTQSIRETNSGSIVLRPMKDIPPTVEEQGIPPGLLANCFPQRGAVYVIGPTGSGKTTLFASLIRHAAETGSYHGHLATYESPPEFDLEALSSRHLVITQTAIDAAWGLPSFGAGVRNALRRHPAAILIGEVRDYETVSAVVEAALTGHPVFGTVHADNPAVAFQRLVTRFPPDQQAAGLYDLITTTETIIAQRLVPNISGGRTPIREWITFTDELRMQLLALPNPGAVVLAIHTMIGQFGRTFKQSAELLLQEGIISSITAESFLKR